MSERDDGGPAFPSSVPRRGYVDEGGKLTPLGFDGISTRDYFAARCPDIEVSKRIPETMGDILNLLVTLGWITKEHRDSPGYAWNKYQNEHMHRLRAWARYQYADAMLEARKQ